MHFEKFSSNSLNFEFVSTFGWTKVGLQKQQTFHNWYALFAVSCGCLVMSGRARAGGGHNAEHKMANFVSKPSVL